MSDFEYAPFQSRAEQIRARDLISQCFQIPESRWEIFRDNVGTENFRRLTREGKLAAVLGIYPVGQWFGGRRVPSGAIAVVGVPPEERASGAGFEIMRRTLADLRQRGVPLSVLYPATQRLYRKAGYEQAGFYCLFTVPARSIERREHELPVLPVDPQKHEIFHQVHLERARRGAGQLDRNPGMWRRVVNHPVDRVYAYLLGSEHDPLGYVVFTQMARESGYDLRIRDMAAITPAAARSLWTFLSDHRSLARNIEWIGPPNEPMLALLPEQDARITTGERWFLRIVDVAAALETRGYPETVRGRLVLEVEDEVLPENAGRFVLDVAEGRGVVATGTPESRGVLRLHVRALASLYSGIFTPRQLHDLGWVEGDQDALTVASQIFAGPVPWMADGF
jgi:predicted acetyltransferase